MKILRAFFFLAPILFGQTVVSFPNAGVFFSPYNWRFSSGAAICPVGQGYIRFQVSGTVSVVLNVDTSINAGLAAANMPSVRVVVSTATEDGVGSVVLFPANNSSNTPVTVASGLTPSRAYSVWITAVGANMTAGSGWTASQIWTKINSLQVDSGASVVLPALRSKRAMFWGDSYLKSYFGGSQTGNYSSYVDPSRGWPFFVAYAINAEWGQVGIGSQGWASPGEGGYPNFASSWDHFDSGNLKTFSPAPDFVFIALGINDYAQNSALVQTNVTTVLTSMRAAFGTQTVLFVVLPINRMQAGAIAAGVAAVGDAGVHILDPGTEFSQTVFTNPASPVPTWASPDGLHLDSTYQQLYTAFVVAQSRVWILPVPLSVRGVVTIR